MSKMQINNKIKEIISKEVCEKLKYIEINAELSLQVGIKKEYEIYFPKNVN
jgi:hypothetical protein